MHVNLLRTFSIAHEPSDDDVDWTQYFESRRDRLTWADLHAKRISVVIGEAGIGKTIEFKNETERLRQRGKAAFFVELSQLDGPDSWDLALSQSATEYAAWLDSQDDGYFFLDAVDEARLTSHATLKRALMVASARLRDSFTRVHLAISSRHTDWSIEDVRRAIEDLLVVPIAVACRVTPASVDKLDEGATTIRPDVSVLDEAQQAFVVSLDPLSIDEAQRLADAWEVPDGQAFWAAISDGEYQHLATRPLDLSWMVELWKDRRNLGTYLELVEGSIGNRLTETNPSYHAAGAVMSATQLRVGAEWLAATAEFSGLAYITADLTLSPRANEIGPAAALPNWSGTEVKRLLASALFDEATFGRVKFHHRTVRAYLAAAWIHREMSSGVPMHRFLPLFCATPFDEPVLIPARRWALCWLAAINSKVREWVIRSFPAILLFDGDPEAWDALSANEAFSSYVRRRKEGFRPDWWNNASEFRRVGKRLSAGLLASFLSATDLPNGVKVALLPIAKYAQLTDCTEPVFSLYSDATASPRERELALDALSAIATQSQRDLVMADLLSGALHSNELISSAMKVVGSPRMTAAEMAQIFENTSSEQGYGTGPMARTVTTDLLPEASLADAEKVIEALMLSFPSGNDGQRVAKIPESSQPPRSWILDVLPDAFERLLTLVPKTEQRYPRILFQAAEVIESFRHAWYSENEELRRIHDGIAEHPNLRWPLALTLVRSPHIDHVPSRMTWGTSCIVSFGVSDMSGLLARANDVEAPAVDRTIWFSIAKDVVMRLAHGGDRKAALIALANGPDGTARALDIAAHRSQIAINLCERRRWDVEARHRKAEARVQQETERARLEADIDGIRNATHVQSLYWLMQSAYNRSSRASFTKVNYSVIATDFGQAVADALSDGLKQMWRACVAPNPCDFLDGNVPLTALAALAGLHTLLAEGLTIHNLNEEDTVRAGKLAVWELNRPPSWFEPLVAAHGPTVIAALRSWILEESQRAAGSRSTPRTLELALHCSPVLSAALLEPVLPAVLGNEIENPEMFQSVFDRLRAANVISSDALTTMCQSKLTQPTSSDGLLTDTRWLRVWLEENVRAAWSWFEGQLSTDEVVAHSQVRQFAESLGDFKWVRMPADRETISVLLRIRAVASRYWVPDDSTSREAEQDPFTPTVTRLRETIPGLLVQVPGRAAHQALLQFLASEDDPDRKVWLIARVAEHDVLEADRNSRVNPNDLHAIIGPLAAEPRNEAALYQQALGRLEEIRTGIEAGPFSDRSLFAPGMPEKKLQLWLAARFRDTPNRRYSIHREEVVDADNKTDIQLSALSWNICVEIKPLDVTRSYSALSLTETLRIQIVEQYLRGFNSSCGILVLFRLDEKRWEVPGLSGSQPFSALVEYLQVQARTIKTENPDVQELIVFPIDCIAPA